MIKAVVFDLGGVVCFEDKGFIEEKVATVLGIKRREYKNLSKKYMPAVTKGEITLVDFYKRVIAKSHSKENAKKTLTAHIAAYKKTNRLNRRVVELIGKLKRRHIVACMTNTELEIAKISRASGLFRLFNRRFISTEIGLMKPQAKMFERMIVGLNLKPEEIVYIDDKMENIRAGRKKRLKCIHYHGYEALVKELTKALNP
jgi:putative hydrolase of the HAD superfamily